MKVAARPDQGASAPSIEQANAAARLRQLGGVVETPDGTGVRPLDTNTGRRGRHVKELALWSRQLHVLVRSGTPIAQALEAIERQTTPGKWYDMLATLRRNVEEGTALSTAMARHPAHFDDVTRSLIAAGESSGQLAPLLDRVSSLVRQRLKTRRALIGAMVYPLVLVGVGGIVIVVMLLGVIPRFSELFESLNAALPPTTAVLLMASSLIRGYWWLGMLGLAGAIVGGRFYASSDGGRVTIDRLLISLPVLGKMMRSLATARIARLLGVMLESRVPLLDALRLTQHSTGNRQYVGMMGHAVDCASRGEPISTVFARSNLITPSVCEAIRHGERNGQIGPILSDMADFLDEENAVIVQSAMSILEPLILVLLGVVVGFIALSLFIPLFDLAATAGAT